MESVTQGANHASGLIPPNISRVGRKKMACALVMVSAVSTTITVMIVGLVFFSIVALLYTCWKYWIWFD